MRSSISVMPAAVASSCVRGVLLQHLQTVRLILSCQLRARALVVQAVVREWHWFR
jgi:hypothetical protein